MAAKEKLGKLVGKKHILFTPSGDHAIKFVLRALKTRIDKALIQDQGGWLTYEQFLRKNRIPYEKIRTDIGLVNPANLKPRGPALLLVNSMPAYACYQDMGPLAKACKERSILLINDVSGSIGTKEATYGDIILGSFGKAKPLGMEDGGFIATDDKAFLDALQQEDYLLDKELLEELIDALPDRIRFWQDLQEETKHDLSMEQVLHLEKKGFNVLVKTPSSPDQQRILDYCMKNSLSCRKGPEYIRAMTPSVSIEIKQVPPQ